eukprot:symbB.v1.2.015476.t1/scaffold1156.1/size134879/6
MGLPERNLVERFLRESLSSHAADVIDAPFRLQTESYEDFARLLPGLEQDGESRASVNDELRRLDIDPKIFYRNHNRLRVTELPPELLDPTATGSFEPAKHEACDMFSPPARVETAKSPMVPGKEGCPLNVPADQASPVPHACEEISLAHEGETHGGRLGHETPEDLTSRLQIDQLTDDGDDAEFREDLAGCDEDVAFSLDPDFDYDNTEGLSSKVESHIGEMMLRSAEKADQRKPEEPKDEILEDAVEEP